MELEKGKIYQNKTYKYLAPCLKHYGKDLVAGLTALEPIAFGIGDYGAESIAEDCIYMVFSSVRASASTILKRLRTKPYFIKDYLYQLKDPMLHMIVFKIPEDFTQSYIHFLNGDYTKMYTKDFIEEYVREENRGVLLSTKEAMELHIKTVNDMFNTKVTTDTFTGKESEFKINYYEEIFNYN